MNPGEWILCSYQPAFDEDDRVVGISVSVLDITRQKNEAEALREREFALQHHENFPGHRVWVMDPEGQDLQMSSEWVQRIPGPNGSGRNLGWLEALHLNDLKSVIRKMKKAIRTGQPIDMEYRVQDTDGQWRWMRSRGSPRFGPDGSITRWYGSVEDINDQKRAILQAKKTKAKLRSLLKGVPIAILVNDTGGTVISISNSLAEPLASLPASLAPPSAPISKKKRARAPEKKHFHKQSIPTSHTERHGSI